MRAPSLRLGVLALSLLGLACGDDDTAGPTGAAGASGAGRSGAGGSVAKGGAGGRGGAGGTVAKGGSGGTAGKGGAGGTGGTAGTAGTAGKGGTAGAGGSTPAGGAGQGGAAGKAGTAGAAGTATANGGTAQGGSAGGGGAAGSAQGGAAGSGQGGTGPGGQAGNGAGGATQGGNGGSSASVVPTTCGEAHGDAGCCGPDGNAYYFTGTSVVVEDCGAKGKACGWTGQPGFYACVGGASEDPTGGFPRACGGPVPAATSCPAPCSADSDCAGQASPALRRCDPQAGICVACLVEADCGVGEACSAARMCEAKECTTDAQCKTASLPACNATTFKCVECNADAACAKSPYGSNCDVVKHLCSCDVDAECSASSTGGKCVKSECSCVADGDCKDPKLPACVTIEGLFGSSQSCAECGTDADCSKGAKKSCNTDAFVCAECNDDFDCPDPANAKCVADAKTGVKSCGTADVCTGDDAREPNDDGVAGATALVEGAEIRGKICDAGDEADYFKLVVGDADEVTITVTADDPTQKIYFFVLDFAGNALGLALHGSTDVARLTFLPKGTYYVQVKVLGGSSPDPVAKGYKIGLARVSGNKCKAVVDCATEFAHQFFRGTCDTATGACMPVDGKKTKKTGEICDLNGDCETEKCAGGQLAMNQDKLSVCSTACVNEVTGALDDTKCNVGICGLYGICTVECTADEECPLSAATDPPPAGKAWSYLPCKAGRCTRP